MLKQVYELTDAGLIREVYAAELDEYSNILYLDSFDISSVTGNLVTVDLPSTLYTPIWNGEEWTEGATQEEIDALNKVYSPHPTIEQRTSDLEDIVNMMLTGGI